MDYRKQRGSSIPPKVFGKEGRRVVCRCSMGGIMANVAVQAVAIACLQATQMYVGH